MKQTHLLRKFSVEKIKMVLNFLFYYSRDLRSRVSQLTKEERRRLEKKNILVSLLNDKIKDKKKYLEECKRYFKTLKIKPKNYCQNV